MVPWRVYNFIDERWPRLAHLLRFGTLNVNTAAHWDDAWSRHGVGGFRATDELGSVRERLLQEIPHGATVLDVGCGAGELLSLLRTERQCIGSGVDISAVAVDKTRRAGFEARVAALPDVPYPAQAFDVVLCTETMEHVSDVMGSLREIARVLRPGGRLFMSVPDGTVDRESVHVHRFTVPGLRQVLEKHFSQVTVETIADPRGRTLLASGARPEAP